MTSRSGQPSFGRLRDEDQNYNGIYDLGVDFDENNNGTLEPGNVATIVKESDVTDDEGFLAFDLVYPQDHAYYATVDLLVTVNVSGTEHTASQAYLLDGVVTDFDTENVPPPGESSPFGTAGFCSDPN